MNDSTDRGLEDGLRDQAIRLGAVTDDIDCRLCQLSDQLSTFIAETDGRFAWAGAKLDEATDALDDVASIRDMVEFEIGA